MSERVESFRNFSVFIYGRKVRIKYKNSITKCVMQLNPNNNFFLEFVAFEAKLKIIMQIFIPYILNLRCKADKKQIKIRLEKHEDSLYIYSENHKKLEELSAKLNKLIEYVKTLKYAPFSWRNLLYNLLYELKIYKNKENLFSDAEVKTVIQKIKLKNPHSDYKDINTGMKEELREFGFKMIDTDIYEEKRYFSEIKKQILSMFKDRDALIDIKLVEKIFELLAVKNELGNIFKHYIDLDSSSEDHESAKSLEEDKISRSQNYTAGDYSEFRNPSSKLSDAKLSKTPEASLTGPQNTIKSGINSSDVRKMRKPNYFLYETHLQGAPMSLRRVSLEKSRSSRSFSMVRGKSQRNKINKNPDLLFSTLANNAVRPLDFTNLSMKFSKFLFFLQDYQKMQLSAHFKKKLQVFFMHIRIKNMFDYHNERILSISFEEFCMFIFSKLNGIIDPARAQICVESDKPLSYFFINSSHNTYLTGHQLYGKSGVEGYERALEAGCRCLEIDCWDSVDGPVVTHGHTFIKNYPFKGIITTIAHKAFKDNEFPLVISLEMHCNLSNRNIIAQSIQEAFGPRLFILSSLSTDLTLTLGKVMGKVLIKSSLHPQSKVNGSKTERMGEKLSNDPLLSITSLYSTKEKNLSRFKACEMLSLNESRMCLVLWYANAENDIMKFNTEHISRVYPDPTRISSDNFNPIEFWSAGCQMIALNIQSKDDYSLMNKIFFCENGGKKGGFVPKPFWLCDKERIAPSLSRYKIEVLSAQIVNKDLLDENDYLEISFRGHAEDEKRNSALYRLNFHPNFLHPTIIQSKQKILFDVQYSEVAFFVFKITNNAKLKNVGMIKASCVRQGLRVLELYDTYLFHNYYSFLLLRLAKKSFINIT